MHSFFTHATTQKEGKRGREEWEKEDSSDPSGEEKNSSDEG